MLRRVRVKPRALVATNKYGASWEMSLLPECVLAAQSPRMPKANANHFQLLYARNTDWPGRRKNSDPQHL